MHVDIREMAARGNMRLEDWCARCIRDLASDSTSSCQRKRGNAMCFRCLEGHRACVRVNFLFVLPFFSFANMFLDWTWSPSGCGASCCFCSWE